MSLLPNDLQSKNLQLPWWARLTFLLALSTSATLTSLTVLVFVPHLLLVPHGTLPVFSRDLFLLALAGCGLLMATTHLMQAQLPRRDRSTAMLVTAAGMLVAPCAMAIYLHA